MGKLWHKLEHLLGINKGNCDSFYEGDKLMMSFLCECGERSGVHCVDGLIDNLINKTK